MKISHYMKLTLILTKWEFQTTMIHIVEFDPMGLFNSLKWKWIVKNYRLHENDFILEILNLETFLIKQHYNRKPLILGFFDIKHSIHWYIFIYRQVQKYNIFWFSNLWFDNYRLHMIWRLVKDLDWPNSFIYMSI